jgi:hypothetical protein
MCLVFGTLWTGAILLPISSEGRLSQVVGFLRFGEGAVSGEEYLVLVLSHRQGGVIGNLRMEGGDWTQVNFTHAISTTHKNIHVLQCPEIFFISVLLKYNILSFGTLFEKNAHVGKTV